MTGTDSFGSDRARISARGAALALALLLLLANMAAGQELRTVSPDDLARARIATPEHPISTPAWTRGRVAAATPDSLWLRVERRPEPMVVAGSDLLGLQVGVPRSLGQGMLRGALFGALAGAGAGLLAGAATGGGDEGFGSSASLVYWAGGGAMVGVPVGALVGAAFRGSRWVPARLPAFAP